MRSTVLEVCFFASELSITDLAFNLLHLLLLLGLSVIAMPEWNGIWTGMIPGKESDQRVTALLAVDHVFELTVSQRVVSHVANVLTPSFIVVGVAQVVVAFFPRIILSSSHQLYFYTALKMYPKGFVNVSTYHMQNAFSH